MPRLTVVSGEEAIRTPEQMGFRRARQRGSHVIIREDTPEGATAVRFPCTRNSRSGH